MHPIRALILTALLALMGIPAIASAGDSPSNTLKLDPRASPPKATIADMAWLQGRWVGTGLGGTVEEVWTPPSGNSMLGMFRLMKGDKIAFCEICTITEVGGSLLLRVKHFNGNLVGREEKDASIEFPLVKLAANEAFFHGLTYRKEADGSLRAYVVIHKKNGDTSEEAFQFRPGQPENTGARAK
jgi:hypothetical protein